MDIKELITGTFEDYWSRLDTALDGLTREELAWIPNAACNPISFIVWHMARVEDRWIHYFARGSEDLWVQQAWDKQFGLAASDHGVGFTVEQLAAFPVVSRALLCGYLDVVKQDARAFLQDFQSTVLKSMSSSSTAGLGVPSDQQTCLWTKLCTSSAVANSSTRGTSPLTPMIHWVMHRVALFMGCSIAPYSRRPPSWCAIVTKGAASEHSQTTVFVMC
jgi:DinB superfamily